MKRKNKKEKETNKCERIDCSAEGVGGKEILKYRKACVCSVRKLYYCAANKKPLDCSLYYCVLMLPDSAAGLFQSRHFDMSVQKKHRCY